jgi:hypothetical protein
MSATYQSQQSLQKDVTPWYSAYIQLEVTVNGEQ